ncbi:MAG: lipid-A-disaccharide synthase N-terminal domain-containing protein [Acidobacteriota bacterium]|nr:MAG: lipid-A-disaccharide synthase N-terminal domain-containing protein [Acidobacteriota bacterium]
MVEKLVEIFSQGVGFWEVVGFVGLVVFSSRFIIQWIASEKKKESVIPVSFWYLSIVGSLCLLAYALVRQDPIFILSYLFNGFIYLRNLYFVYSKRKAAEVSD